eukprot:204370_1
MATVPTIKLCMLGGGGQGKSALVMKFITGSFLADYDPTIEDTFSKNVTVNNDSALIEILDTAGQEVFWSMQEQWIRDSEIFFLVYSICSRDGFKTCDLLRNKIIEVKEKTSIPIILVGTHSDLSSERVIEKDQAQQKATNWDCEYIETSSLTCENLIELFNMVLPLYFEQFGGGNSGHMNKEISQELAMQHSSSSLSNCLCCNLCNDDDDDDLEFDDDFDSDFHHIHKKDNKIQFFKTEELLPNDSIPSPILSLKNFRIARTFYWKRFFKAAISGIFVPIVVIFQTIIFLTYSERSKNINIFMKSIEKYDDKSCILYDYLGMVVGRKPGQDPEIMKDYKWFLRQTKTQLIKRIFITIAVCLVFIVCCYNISQTTKQKGKVSLIETVGPFILFWIVWLLLSVWIGYDQQLKPSLPKPARLRSLTIFFGEQFSHRSSVYKFVRAYESSRTNNRWKLNKIRTAIVLILGALYSLTPGLTRLTFGDSSEDNNNKRFFSTDGDIILEIGALLVNFVLISSILYCVEIQYKKQFDNYLKWMSDLTQILHKKEAKRDAFRGSYDQKMVELPSKGSAVSKDLFISMTRRQNALGWLEIRSYLEVQGQILFGEQELPTIWFITITCLLVFFTFYRVFFIIGNALESILFNGTAILTIICLIALIRVLITAYQFETLQISQEKLLSEQKFYMICNRPYDNLLLDSHAIGSMERNRSQQSKSKLIQNPLHDMYEENDNDNKEELLNTNQNDNNDNNNNNNETKTIKIKFDSSYNNNKNNIQSDE